MQALCLISVDRYKRPLSASWQEQRATIVHD